MSKELNSTIEAIGKLISLTRDGAVVWKVTTKDQIEVGKDEHVIIAFETTHLKKRLRIYEKTYVEKIRKKTLNNLKKALSVYTFPGYLDEEDDFFEEIRRITFLEIIDYQGNSVWTFPYESIMEDLMETVKYSSSGAKEFINQLLEEK